MRRLLRMIGVVMVSASATAAQANSITVDGIISPGEYGSTQNGTNQIATLTGQTWYMTWDSTALYVGITNANLAEAAILYIDDNPLAPPTSGTNADGNLAGFPYDNTGFASLPFRADVVTYFKDSYREFRNADGAAGWSAMTSFFGQYASGPGQTRELAIPWTAITGFGMPASFDFVGYLTSGGGFVFGQVPNDNPAGFIGLTAADTHYFRVANTSSPQSPPFGDEEPQPAVVPEPSTLMLMLTTSTAFAFVRRRRRA
jgi:hypothetical protein